MDWDGRSQGPTSYTNANTAHSSANGFPYPLESSRQQQPEQHHHQQPGQYQYSYQAHLPPLHQTLQEQHHPAVHPPQQGHFPQLSMHPQHQQQHHQYHEPVQQPGASSHSAYPHHHHHHHYHRHNQHQQGQAQQQQQQQYQKSLHKPSSLHQPPPPATPSSTAAAAAAAAAASSGASTKRDKRRQGLNARLLQLGENFEAERDHHYREMLRRLQETLASLHRGDNEELLERVADVEEKRDAELVTLRLWEQYQTERAHKEYEREVKLASDEHSSMMDMVKERLMSRLENQRKRLQEDKALVDMANDHSIFLSASYSLNGNGGNGGTNNNTNNNGSNGQSNNIGTPTSPSLQDRRNTRRRQDLASATYDELSGLSGTEGGRASKRQVVVREKNAGRLTGVSDVEQGSDRDVLDGVLFAKERDVPVSTRHSSRSYQGVPVLKAEEAMEDLALIRSGQKRKR